MEQSVQDAKVATPWAPIWWNLRFEVFHCQYRRCSSHCSLLSVSRVCARRRRNESSRPVVRGTRGLLRLPTPFFGEHLNHFRPQLQDFLDTSYDVLRLEWLAVVLADVAMSRDPRLGPQVARELAALVVLDDDDPPALAQD